MPDEVATVVNNDAVQDAAAAETTTVETQSSEESQAEPKFKSVISESGEVQQVEAEDESGGSEDGEGDEAPKKGAEARKEQLSAQASQASEEIRQMVAEKNRLVAERQQAEMELAEIRANAHQRQMQQQIPTVQQLMQMENPESKDFYTEFEARTIVENLTLKQELQQAEQQRQADAYNAQVAESVNGLAGDAERALRDFSVFDDQSPDYDEVLAARADEIVQAALIHDRYGNIIGSNIPVYQVYRALSESAQPRQSAPAKATVDADHRGSGQQMTKKFSDMSTAEMEVYLRKKGHQI